MNSSSLIYCHGELKKAPHLGDGWHVCPCCGHRFRVVAPDDDELAEAA